MNRILITCTDCLAQVQTDEDQATTDQDTFHELVVNLTGDEPADHVHTLQHDVVS